MERSNFNLSKKEVSINKAHDLTTGKPIQKEQKTNNGYRTVPILVHSCRIYSQSQIRRTHLSIYYAQLGSDDEEQLMGDTEAVVLKVYNHIILEKEDAATAVNETLNF